MFYTKHHACATYGSLIKLWFTIQIISVHLMFPYKTFFHYQKFFVYRT